MNVTAGGMQAMYERAEFAKELGSVIIMIDVTIGYPAMQSMAKCSRKNGLILLLHRAGHSTYTHQKTHGVSFRVIAKWCRLIGVDHELMQIADLMIDKLNARFTSDASDTFAEYLRRRMQQPFFANARGVRNAIGWARLRQANRCSPQAAPSREMIS